jgi:hypothetical protein
VASRVAMLRAIHVAAITRAADGKQAVATEENEQAKRDVHLAAAARADWTRPSSPGTTKMTGSIRRSIEAVTGGLEGSSSRPSPQLLRPQLMQRAREGLRRRGSGRCRNCGRTIRAHSSLENPHRIGGFPQASTALSFSFKTKNEEQTTSSPRNRGNSEVADIEPTLGHSQYMNLNEFVSL